MNPTLKWVLAVQLLLTEHAVSCAQTWPAPEGGQYHNAATDMEGQKQEGQPLVPWLPLEPGHPSGADEGVLGLSGDSHEVEDRAQSARDMVTAIAGVLGRVQPTPLRVNASCKELLAATSLEDPSSALFPRELLGLSLVPVLAASGCPEEAQAVVLRLFELLGVADTTELLLDLEDLIERSSRPRATPAPPPGRWDQAERHLQAIMFNIQQLAGSAEAPGQDATEAEEEARGRCQGWIRVNGTSLLGGTAGDEVGLREAVQACESLGPRCAGVSSGERPGRYRAVLRRGSRVLPSGHCECWIRECRGSEGQPDPRRVRRSPEKSCVNKKEERVYNVVEWIPGVSTLYNLGTAVYYASVNCSETAKERAILSAVDLGTDALMAVTGGTVGVAGYALGAGVKTGVKAGIKYLLNTMKHEDDLLVNQNSWTTSITIQ
ncbi:uncharacterized protein apof [Megalops cyprinoides]|uniref:uncharacterized protein apof n=1 Tax=Megalops cyprinoides TaxID=118141 RepID=UPI001863CEDE|nr:uncharacterized protein apof [Megalops cyprinoides]